MFKKPLGQLKTSAPLRASDRRKLKQRVVSLFATSPEDGDLLVPEGIQTAKFSTYANEPGILYLDPSNGNPLWFTIGKGSEELIPAIYTLWKLATSNLLPSVLTPPAVIPILAGGADLMIPGVITHTPSTLAAGRLVAIHQLSSAKNEDGSLKQLVSPPLAVGTMALSGENLAARKDRGEKGKAVLVLHTWKDHLWEMGTKDDIPPSVYPVAGTRGEEKDESETEGGCAEKKDDAKEEAGSSSAPEKTESTTQEAPPAPETQATPKISYTSQETTDLLTKSLIHAIATQLSSLPASTFPISSTQLYASYILPSRPAFPTSVTYPSAAGDATRDEKLHIDPVDITIKSSTHKSLTTFLKAAEKALLLTLKHTKQKSGGGDLLIMSVNAQHPDVQSYFHGKHFVTIREIEATAAKKAEREEQAKKERNGVGKEIGVRELWKPHLASVALFEEMNVSKSGLYTLSEIKTLLNAYIASNQLVNARNQAYVNLNEELLTCISSKSGGSGKKTGKDPSSSPALDAAVGSEFMKREELLKRVVEQMQSWHEVHVEGRDVVAKKGELKPIQVVVKVRQGRKASTLITGFEPFLVIEAEEMAEELRKTCAGAASVSPVQGTGKPGMEVAVQGKQSKAAVDYLMEKGIPKKWIEAVDIVVSKK